MTYSSLGWKVVPIIAATAVTLMSVAVASAQPANRSSEDNSVSGSAGSSVSSSVSSSSSSSSSGEQSVCKNMTANDRQTCVTRMKEACKTAYPSGGRDFGQCIAAAARSLVLPHVLERMAITEQGTPCKPGHFYDNGKPCPEAKSAFSGSVMPSVTEIEQMIQKKTGAQIVWKDPVGKSNKQMYLKGTGVIGDTQNFTIECKITTKPFSINCTINFSL